MTIIPFIFGVAVVSAAYSDYISSTGGYEYGSINRQNPKSEKTERINNDDDNEETVLLMNDDGNDNDNKAASQQALGSKWTLHDLNDDVLFKIFDYLDDSSLLNNVRMVCPRLFKAVEMSVQRRLKIGNWLPENNPEKDSKNTPENNPHRKRLHAHLVVGRNWGGALDRSQRLLLLQKLEAENKKLYPALWKNAENSFRLRLAMIAYRPKELFFMVAFFVCTCPQILFTLYYVGVILFYCLGGFVPLPWVVTTILIFLLNVTCVGFKLLERKTWPWSDGALTVPTVAVPSSTS